MGKHQMTGTNDLPSYTVGRWHEMECYQCLLCPFDTLDRPTIEAHIAERHMPAPARRPVTIPIYDRFGNLISEREE